MGNAACAPYVCCSPRHLLDDFKEGEEGGEHELGCRRGEGTWHSRHHGAPTNRVQLAVTELFSLPGLATAFHTSVLVNDEEFFFSGAGVLSDRALTSHQGCPTEPLVELGESERTGYQLLRAMRPHFKEGSYDMVRKNCNSFSDCAIHFLLGRRLDRRYSALERLGMRAGPEMIEKVLKDMYQPNEAADGFTVQGVISAVERMAGAGFGDEFAAKPSLVAGACVTLVGLRSSSYLNGKGATILRFNPGNARWEARLHISGETKAFRAENMRPAGELVLEPGDIVRIHGLMSEQGRSLNGREGEVLCYVHETSRYRLQLGDEARDFRAENLTALRIGSAVRHQPSQELLL